MRKINLTKFQVATSLTAREINRRIILNVVRTRQPISRADLARHTGLQRSTVSLIADQLISEGWVKEGAFGRLPRGRRPIHLHLNSDVHRVMGIDIRPTMTSIVVSDLNGEFLEQRSFETNPDVTVFLPELGERVLEVINQSKAVYQGIGVSVPGRVTLQGQKLIFAPNLGWRNVDIKTHIERVTGVPTEIENAANACALSEIYFGKDTDEIDSLIAVTVSEGIGAGIVANGQLVRGPRGTAGEFGHVSVDPDGPLCACGNRGCWEMFASNKAVRRYWQELAEKAGHPNGEKPFSDILRLAHEGNDAAKEALHRMGEFLGLGMSMLVSGFAPTVIVVVGEVTRAWDIIGPIIHKTVAARSQEMIETRIIPAKEELQPRLRGAVALVMEKHFGAPMVA